MRVLCDGGGTWLIGDSDDCPEMQTYNENKWAWDDNHTGMLTCGDSELHTDVEVEGDVDGDCVVKISYLVNRGGGRYERVNYRANFSGREIVGKWEEIDE